MDRRPALRRHIKRGKSRGRTADDLAVPGEPLEGELEHSRRSNSGQDQDAGPDVALARPESTDKTESDLEPRKSTFLMWFDTTQGTVAVALVGLLISIASFLTTTSIAQLAALGPLAFACVLWVSLRRGGYRVILAAVVLLLSVIFAVRVYSAPGSEEFFYGGEQMDTSGIPFVSVGSIPLTDDPAVGYQVSTIDPLPSDAGPIDVSCTFDGVISTGARATSMEWAHVVGGKYKTLWVPVPFLRGLAPGTANSLSSCSSWRWRLQNLDFS